jgi:hypothetical protein
MSAKFPSAVPFYCLNDVLRPRLVILIQLCWAAASDPDEVVPSNDDDCREFFVGLANQLEDIAQILEEAEDPPATAATADETASAEA